MFLQDQLVSLKLFIQNENKCDYASYYAKLSSASVT